LTVTHNLGHTDYVVAYESNIGATFGVPSVPTRNTNNFTINLGSGSGQVYWFIILGRNKV